jgi:hypothetical protein
MPWTLTGFEPKRWLKASDRLCAGSVEMSSTFRPERASCVVQKVR